MTETVRETRRADELKVGDWLREDENGALKPNEVKAVFQYPAAAGIRVHLTTQVPGRKPFSAFALEPDALFELASDAEVGALREQAERAQKLADIRALADWLKANPEVPMPYGIGGQADLSDSQSYSAAEVDAVRAFAEKHGGEFREGKDHTSARVRFGGVTYSLISWHKDGRPSEPETEHAGPGVECQRCKVEGFEGVHHDADPLGLAYTRADDEPDDPTPVSGARVPMHNGGMTDGGLVDETPELRLCWHSDDCPGSGPDCGPA